jgi:hypothetical protein
VSRFNQVGPDVEACGAPVVLLFHEVVNPHLNEWRGTSLFIGSRTDPLRYLALAGASSVQGSSDESTTGANTNLHATIAYARSVQCCLHLLSRWKILTLSSSVLAGESFALTVRVIHILCTVLYRCMRHGAHSKERQDHLQDIITLHRNHMAGSPAAITALRNLHSETGLRYHTMTKRLSST